MGVQIDKYVDIVARYVKLGEKGYYIQPIDIIIMLKNELHFSYYSFDDLKKFVSTCSITLKEDEIKCFLREKMDEENPTLRADLQNSKVQSKSLYKTEDDIEIEGKNFFIKLLQARYQFEPYLLIYFKTYVSILKDKCTALFDVLEDLRWIEKGYSERAWRRFDDLDFHVKYDGSIHYADAVRLANAMIYNINDLHQKVMQGNDFQTYLTFKEAPHRLISSQIFEREIYPKKEIQIKDLNYADSPQFIALSEKQKAELWQMQVHCYKTSEKDNTKTKKKN